MGSTKLFIIFSFCIFTSPIFAQSTGTITGRVTDAKTGEPLIGATVVLEGTELGDATNPDGRFTIDDIPTKTYNVKASYVGFVTQTRFNVVVRSEGNIDLNFELEEQVSELDDVTITPNPFAKSQESPISIQKFSQEEITSYPGGNNDIAKVVQSLPGVSGSVGGFRNDVIIRGGAPNENVYYLDGVPIPNINHFSTQGSAGGPVSLLNVSFFEGVSLTASSFGAQYENVLSGVLQFNQRTGNDREFVGNLRLSSSEAALTVEGPLFKGNDTEAKTTYIASVRRSYLQLLFQVIGLPFLPDYWDYQYKINHRFDKYNTLYITGIGSIDDLAINDMDDLDPEQEATQNQIPVIRQNSNTVGIGWRRQFQDNSGFMETVVSNNTLGNFFYRYDDNVNETGLFLENESRETETHLRYRLTKFIDNWTATGGFQLINSDYYNSTRDFINNRSFRSDINFFRYGLFGQASADFLQNRLSFTMGLRADGNTFTETGNELWRTLSPRVGLAYDLTPDQKWTVNGSVGRYYKILPYTTLGFQDNVGNFPNKDTEYIRSDHAVVGLEYLLNERARISAEGFFKWYDDYPISTTDSVSLANKGGDFEVFGSEPVISAGQGRTYGLELLYQQKFTGKFYGVAAFTFYKSEFTNLRDAEYKPAVWDNGVLVSLLGGYKFGNNWEVSGRYRFLGKAPYAPVDQDKTEENYPAVFRDFDRLGTVRLDPLSQLDIRIDKKFNFDNLSLDVFLEVQNALAQEGPSEPRYGLERNESGEIITPRKLVQVSDSDDGQVLPSFGIVLNF
ncbi:TonB-dependent receptor [Gracilimonas mengyeensis]|uniref:Outer membrane receptor proteins, mostly Fe transport n=1 Tax=Gracilimonas mengyeensis TaxID=1302730 RepID=A0A521E5H2_9BACT|nr:TonB-dependent receptor [Gracilimonas mengyeensis]SMO79112.1 Outer membrane receptor proteins, mostly Fe transport [Gracilimonas mengyeensis]